jgi:hypothetical protein
MTETATVDAPGDTPAPGTADQQPAGTPTPTPPAPAEPAAETVAALRAELDKWKAHTRKQEERAKSNAEAAKRADALQAELEQFRQASMSEQEKALAQAVKEAEARARGEVLTSVGQRLVRAEFRAQAAGAIPDLDGVLDDLNLSKFVTDDGEPDVKAIATAVRRLTPPPPPEQPAEPTTTPGPRPDLTQGTRQNMPLNGDPLLAAVKSRLGITG